MASPPFNIDQTVPADNGIVSQFPLQERTMRDNAKSWLSTDHNTNGRHAQISLDQTTPDISTAPTATTLMLWADTVGQTKCFWGGTGAGGVAEMLSIPPGTILPFTGTTLPAGYLWPNGTAVSRTTYARLFAAIGTTFGAGDGSTTFNVPDTRAVVLVGRDNMGGAGTRGFITVAGGNVDGTVMNGSPFGAQNVTLTANQMPIHSHTMTIVSGTENQNHTHNFSGTTAAAATGISGTVPIQAGLAPAPFQPGSSGSYANSGSTSVSFSDPTHVHSFSGSTGVEVGVHNHTVSGSTDNAGSSVFHINVQPSLIVNFILKY